MAENTKIIISAVDKTKKGFGSVGRALGALTKSIFSMRTALVGFAGVAGFEGALIFDASKPDGTPRKWLDVSRMKALGWEAEISLEDGVRATYEWMVEHWGEVAQ